MDHRVFKTFDLHSHEDKALAWSGVLTGPNDPRATSRHNQRHDGQDKYGSFRTGTH
jgi:hypothetical protein